MAKSLVELREQLLCAGVEPRQVRRYIRELAEHLDDVAAEEEHAGRSGAAARDAALARLGSVEVLAERMIAQRQFRSIAARAPWAVLGIGPLVALSFAYLVEFGLIAAGWNLFMDRQKIYYFNELEGWARLWYEVTVALWIAAPYLIGIGITVVAARQRIRTRWTLLGWALMSCGTVFRLRFGRIAGAWVCRMDYDHPSNLKDFCLSVALALIAFCLFSVPYAIWRRRRARIVA